MKKDSVVNLPMLTKKIVFITGGTSGIGACLVEQYLLQGCIVHTCGKNMHSVKNVKQRFAAYKHSFSVYQVDLGIAAKANAWVKQGLAKWGKIDLLILNAGISMRALVKDSDPLLTEKIMNTNFIANVHIVHASLESLIATKGTILAVSSIASMIGLPGRSAYGASKAALHRWLDSVRKELLDYGVKVLIFSPGFVQTDIRKKALDSKGKSVQKDEKKDKKIMTAERCAKEIITAIHRRSITVSTWTFTTFFATMLNRYAPRWSDKMIHHSYIRNRQLIQ